MDASTQRYEYDFVRLGQSWLRVKSEAMESYRHVVHERARDGWRLVQIFAPGTGVYGVAGYFELVFERPVSSDSS